MVISVRLIMQRDSRGPIALGVRPHYNVVRFEVVQDFQTNFIDSPFMMLTISPPGPEVLRIPHSFLKRF